VKNAPTGGTVQTGYVHYDCIGRPARIAARDLAARAAAADDPQSAASEFAPAAGETYGVPASAVMDAVQTVLDGPAPKAVMDIAKSAVNQVATDLGLAGGPVGDGDFLSAADTLLGSAVAGPVGAIIDGLIGLIVNEIAGMLALDEQKSQVGYSILHGEMETIRA
jgi:hypothetical protein